MRWGMHLDSVDLELYGCAKASHAIESEQLRGCVGLALKTVNGVMVHSPQQVKDMVEDLDEIRLCFCRLDEHQASLKLRQVDRDILETKKSLNKLYPAMHNSQISETPKYTEMAVAWSNQLSDLLKRKETILAGKQVEGEDVPDRDTDKLHAQITSAQGKGDDDVIVTLTRRSFETCVSWGMNFNKDTMVLADCDVGSIAAYSMSLRGCIGRTLTMISDIPVHCLDDMVALTSESKEICLHFSKPLRLPPRGEVSVFLTRSHLETWIPWGLRLSKVTLTFDGYSAGSIAAFSPSARACVGRVLRSVNQTPVHTREDVLAATEDPTELELIFGPLSSSWDHGGGQPPVHPHGSALHSTQSTIMTDAGEQSVGEVAESLQDVLRELKMERFASCLKKAGMYTAADIMDVTSPDDYPDQGIFYRRAEGRGGFFFLAFAVGSPLAHHICPWVEGDPAGLAGCKKE
jgi:hypothetical protein